MIGAPEMCVDKDVRLVYCNGDESWSIRRLGDTVPAGAMSKCDSEMLQDVCAWTQKIIAQQKQRHGDAVTMSGEPFLSDCCSKDVNAVYHNGDESWSIHRLGSTVPAGAMSKCDSEKLQDMCAWTGKTIAQQKQRHG